MRYYGSAEVSSRALHILKHNVGPNYTLFLMLGLNNKLFAYVSEGASDSNTYIEFVHQAVNSYNTNGEPVLYPGCCIVADRVSCSRHVPLQISRVVKLWGEIFRFQILCADVSLFHGKENNSFDDGKQSFMTS